MLIAGSSETLFFFVDYTTLENPLANSYGTENPESHTHTHIQSVGLLWTSDRPVAETSTWQHTTITRDKHPCLRRDLNLKSQQATEFAVLLPSLYLLYVKIASNSPQSELQVTQPAGHPVSSQNGKQERAIRLAKYR